MKRISIYASALLAMASVACTSINEEIFVEEEEQEKIYISASTESHITETKTYLGTPGGNSYPVKWSADDKIALISDEGNIEFTLVPESGNETHATFGGNAAKMPGIFPNTLVYPAAYPVEGAFADGGGTVLKIGSEVPTIQTLVNNLEGDTRCFENNTFPMAAGSTEPTHFQFYNLAGIVRLKIFYTPDTTVPNDAARILRITLKGNNREILSGPVAMQFSAENASPVTSSATKDNGKAVGVYGNDGNEKVIIDLSGETGATSGKTGLDLPTTGDPLQVDLVVIPQTFTNGFTVEIMDASTMGTQIYKVNHEVTVERSKILEMTAIDYVKPDPLEIANCYVVSEPGENMIPAFAFGNRMGTNFKDGFPGFDPDKTEVDILWTDIVEGGEKIDAITDLEYLKFADGSNYVSFKMNADASGKAYRGNIVLALYNETTKEIYWTWHLWLCDQPQDVIIDGKCAKGSYSGVYPDGTGYNYQADATYEKMQILDRNLGAIHAYPDSCDLVGGVRQVWQTYGLYYQDGRRDPFIGGNYNGGWAVKDEKNYSGDEIVTYLHRYEDTAFSNGTHDTWTNIALFGDERGWKFAKGNLTITQTLNYPQKYSFDDSKTWQWTYYLSGDNLSWMDSDKYPAYATHGRTGLLYGNHEAYWNRTKTIFDPCPPGYSVLGERGGYFIGGAGTKNWCGNDTDGYGLMYTYNGNDIWWPAAGVRAIDGCMAGVGKFGFYFFYDHIDKDHGGHGFGFQLADPSSGSASTAMNAKFFKGVSAKDQVLTNHATPVRCVKAKQQYGGPDLEDPKNK